MKRLSFTAAAFAKLDEIHAFSVERFGRRRAETYVDDLNRRCQGLAAGGEPSQSCRANFGGKVRADLRFARSGRHFIIFVESASEVLVIDIVHQSANIARRLEGMK